MQYSFTFKANCLRQNKRFKYHWVLMKAEANISWTLTLQELFVLSNKHHVKNWVLSIRFDAKLRVCFEISLKQRNEILSVCNSLVLEFDKRNTNCFVWEYLSEISKIYFQHSTNMKWLIKITTQSFIFKCFQFGYKILLYTITYLHNYSL